MKPLGKLIVKEQFHGSPVHIADFNSDHLKSLGFHFGDIEQARFFAKEHGYIHECDLHFANIVDIGKQDWGWTCAAFVAHAFFIACILNRIATSHEDFIPFLGPLPSSGWSTARMRITNHISNDEQKALIELFTSYGFDGVRYINNFEPPNRTGGVAYFVINSEQITIKSVAKL